MKKTVFLFSLWMLFSQSFALGANCNGLNPDRFPICKGIEIAIQGGDCAEVGASQVGDVVCKVVSDLVQGKSCEAVSSDRRQACTEAERGLSLRAIEPEKRDRPGPLSDSFWYALGEYLVSHRPSFVKKLEENKSVLGLDQASVKSELYQSLSEADQAKVLRWAKVTYTTAFKLRAFSTVQFTPLYWLEKLSAVLTVMNQENLNQHIPHTIQTVTSPFFRFHVGSRNQIVLHFDRGFGIGELKFESYKTHSLGFDTSTEKMKTITTLGPDIKAKALSGFRVQNQWNETTGIASVDDFFDTKSSAYAVSDFVPWDLGSLKKEMRQYKSWDELSREEMTASFGLQLVEGLEAIHGKKYHHLAINKSNVATDGKNVWLRHFESALNTQKSKVDLDYMEKLKLQNQYYSFSISPEYAVTGDPSLLSDIWALGLVLFDFSVEADMEKKDLEPSNYFYRLRYAPKLETLDAFFHFGGVPFTQVPSSPIRDLARQMMAFEPNQRPSLESVRLKLTELKIASDSGPKFSFSRKLDIPSEPVIQRKGSTSLRELFQNL